MSNHLLLKWGTVKGWNFDNVECEAFNLLREYLKGSSLSCMTDRPDNERKNLLCEIIDKMDGEIQNDWTGEMMTKEEAKNYVITYDENK